DMSRVRTGETDPLNSVHLVDCFEESGKIAIGIVGCLIGGHDLPEELYFPESARCGIPDLGDDLRFRTHPLVSARIWNDAEAADLVAALDDRDPGANRVVAPGEAKRERDVVMRSEVDLRPSGVLCP